MSEKPQSAHHGLSHLNAAASVCVFCGSRVGDDPAFAKLAADLGRALAQRGIRIIYGGGSIGLMGILARAAIDAGGEVCGIIPTRLDELEVAQDGLTELIRVTTMHERKALMADKSDAFVILPGGLGTLDEFFEMTTWRQLAFHDKPMILLDHLNYWQPLLQLIKHAISRGFADPNTTQLTQVVDDLATLLEVLEGALPVERAAPHKNIRTG